jgi:quercetin dioxygenase-like cupin family protein
MTLNIRRVVTGHDAQGRSTVLIDEPVSNQHSPRPGATYSVIWSTDELPASNDGSEDPSNKKIATAIADGSVFRVVSFGPGVTPRNHRTDSIDYAVILSGEIDMDLDGVETHLKTGDVIVQRGTIHNWINRGTEPCVIAFVLIAAHAAVADGKALPAVG